MYRRKYSRSFVSQSNPWILSFNLFDVTEPKAFRTKQFEVAYLFLFHAKPYLHIDQLAVASK